MVEHTIAVNTTSHLHTIREFLPGMIANKRGHIVTIASLAGHATSAGMVDYYASKHGAVGLDGALRYELMKLGHSKYIKTTCICPYFIDTGMFEGTGNLPGFFMLKTDSVVRRVIAAIR